LSEYSDKLETLAPQEKNIFALYSLGKEDGEIASELHISPHTVRNTLERVFFKLGIERLSKRERLREVVLHYAPLISQEPGQENIPIRASELFDSEYKETPNIPDEQNKADAPHSDRGVNFGIPFWGFGLGGIIIIVLLFWVFGGGARFAQDIFATDTPTLTPSLTPSRTPTSPDTQTPSLTPSLTFTPSYTPTTTPTATETLTPSPTQTQTPRPSPTVDFGPIRDLGEWEKVGDVWFRLYSYEIYDDFSPETISFVIEVWNRTNQEIRFSWNPDRNTWLHDNNGVAYHPYFVDSENNEVIPAQSRALVLMGVNDYTSRFEADFIYDANVNEVYYTLYDFSRLELATWRISLAH
jgi:DNA-binding CsgD family transcriptional regulator